jgi:hypothetical protein
LSDEAVGMISFGLMLIGLIYLLRPVYLWYTGNKEIIKNQNEQIQILKRQNDLLKELIEQKLPV